MGELTYEYHTISNAKLPFIFHNNMHARKHNDITNWHTNIELLFFTEGEGQVVCDREFYDVKTGDLFIVNSNCVHNIISDNIVRYHCLIADNEFCKSNDIDTDNIVFQNKICDDKISDIFKIIVDEFTEMPNFFNAATRCAVLELLVYLCRNYVVSYVSKTKSGHKTIENIKIAIAYIQSHFNERLSLDGLAHQTGLSTYHFAREFKKVTGNTVINFINNTRCEYAKKLIQTKKHTINEVCFLSGFNNFSYFTKVYKKFYGHQPSEDLN